MRLAENDLDGYSSSLIYYLQELIESSYYLMQFL